MTSEDTQQERPPVVVVLGHVDHGKTTLLDFLRKTKIAEGEEGGITQSVGAYEITYQSKINEEKEVKKLTFIDTPGHAAFSQMRARGAHIADVAILVVAADDGVKPQTQEAIDILKESGVPYVVAINKIDKNNADVESTKQDLISHDVGLEGLGGDVPWIGISAKAGEHVDELLDLVLLVSEMEQLTWSKDAVAKGFVLEAHKDSNRGIIASLIVKDGVLKLGDDIMTSSAEGNIKILENFAGKAAKELEPSSPAMVIGFASPPLIGEKFVAGQMDIIKKQDLHPVAEEKETTLPEVVEDLEQEERKINVVLRADTAGSLEALAQTLEALSGERARINILSREVGDIADASVQDATARKAWLVGFNVKVRKSAENLAKSQNVRIINSNIIYRIVEAIEEAIVSLHKETEVGILEVLATFSRQGQKQVVGGVVKEGTIREGDRVEIIRDGGQLCIGKILNIQQNKNSVKKVSEGECGMQMRCAEEVQKGDILKVLE